MSFITNQSEQQAYQYITKAEKLLLYPTNKNLVEAAKQLDIARTILPNNQDITRLFMKIYAAIQEAY